MSADANQPTRLERVLAYSSLSLIALAVVSYLTTLIIGLVDRFALAHGFFVFIAWVAYVGLPVGFVLLMILLIVSMRRRSAAQRRGDGK